MASGMEPFMPLSCNSAINESNCSIIALSSLIRNAASTSAEVYIPCGTCAYWDWSDGSQKEIPGGINVEGRLYVPSGASGTIRTPYVFVQGVLKMDPPAATNSRNTKILLYGSSDRYLFPHVNNIESCDEEIGCNVGSKPFVVAGGRLEVIGVESNCLSWVKLKDVNPNNNARGGTELRQIVVDVDANDNRICWNVGDEILLTSPDTSYRSMQHVATIEVIDTNTGEITLTSPIHPAFVEATQVSNPDHPYFAIEVVSLSRRIVLDAEVEEEEDGNSFMGGHLVVYRTPNVSQVLQGVQIQNFGQQGILGRYPINFHLCGDVSGSIISKNVVRASNQRGYVVHGSHNAYFFDNVAFEVAGHCYFLEDGIETGNTFERNLGADIHAPAITIPGDDAKDEEASVFWISNPNNHFRDNVAAGSVASGYWFDTRHHVRGLSYGGNENVHPQTLNLGTFQGNTVHSTVRGIQLYAPGWRPQVQNALFDNKVYRVKSEGWFIHGNTNIAVRGGIVSDCGKGIFIFHAGNIRLDGIEIIGHSENYARVLQKTHTRFYCTDGEYITGMTIHSSLNSFEGDTSVIMGTWARNLIFRRFGSETGCNGTYQAAITMTNVEVLPFYDTPNRFTNLTFDGRMKRLEVCQVDAMDVHNMLVEDSDGTLGPTGNPGFFVSDYSPMTAFANCMSVKNTCHLAFCENVCLRQLTVITNNANVTQDIEMIVSKKAGGSIATKWHHYFFQDTPFEHTFQGYNANYGVALPPGDFHISFRNIVTGQSAWPDYVEPVFLEPPLCADYITSVNLIKPPPTHDRCSNLIKQGQFENETIHAWQQWFATLSLTSPGSNNASFALRVTDREAPYHFVSTFIDVTCMQPGDYYQFTADIRLQIDGVEELCDPTIHGNCPKAEIVFYHYNTESKTHSTTARALAKIYSSDQLNGWYQMQGIFQIFPQDCQASRAEIRISEPANTDYILDNVFLTKTQEPPPVIQGSITNIPHASQPDVAIGSTVTASSHFANMVSYKPEHAVDGMGYTQWASNFEGTDAWIEIHFGASVQLTHIAYKSRPDGDIVSRFIITFSDGSHFIGEMDMDASDQLQYFDMEDVQTSFVRFDVDIGGVDAGAYQLSAFALPTIQGSTTEMPHASQPDVAIGASVTASSYYGNLDSYKPENAVDGVENTQWASYLDGDHAWFEIEFGEPIQLTHIAYKSRTGPNLVSCFMITFSDGTQFIGEMDADASDQLQYFDMEDVQTSSVRFDVLAGGVDTGAYQISAYTPSF